MRTVVEKLAGDAVAKMFIHREILIFGVYGGNMSTGLPDETFRLGQHRLADTMATFVGDHGQTTNHPTSGLIGMVEIRVETACRHGAAVSKSQQMRGSARLIPFVEFRTIILLLVNEYCSIDGPEAEVFRTIVHLERRFFDDSYPQE